MEIDMHTTMMIILTVSASIPCQHERGYPTKRRHALSDQLDEAQTRTHVTQIMSNSHNPAKTRPPGEGIS